MMRIIKRLGIPVILITVLLVAFSGSIFAAGGNTEKGNHGEGSPYCDCNCGDCEPKTNAFKWGNETETLGPHGPYTYKWGNENESPGPRGPYAYKHGKTTE